MKKIFIFLLIILIQLFSIANLHARQKQSEYLDRIMYKIESGQITYYDYVRSEEYKKSKEIIREELVNKLNELIAGNKCQIWDYLLFIDDIADPRYINLMAKLEKQKKCTGGPSTFNIIGYSKYLKLKISKASKDEMLKLLNSKMGDRLIPSISEYIMSQCVTFDEKLKYFKLICDKVDYAHQYALSSYALNDIFESLCVENPKATNDFIKKHGSFKPSKKVLINCDNLEIP